MASKENGQSGETGANMRADLTGTVIAGALKLDAPVAMPDQSRVRVTVESVDDLNGNDKRDRSNYGASWRQ